jgi:hypothetical protein
LEEKQELKQEEIAAKVNLLCFGPETKNNNSHIFPCKIQEPIIPLAFSLKRTRANYIIKITITNNIQEKESKRKQKKPLASSNTQIHCSDNCLLQRNLACSEIKIYTENLMP